MRRCSGGHGLGAVALGLSLVLPVALPAQAQTAPAAVVAAPAVDPRAGLTVPPLQQGWSFTLTPYAWLPGVSGGVTTPYQRLHPHFGMGSGKVLGDLSTVPVMLTAEAHYGRFTLLGDIVYAGMKPELQTKDIAFSGGHALLLNTTAEMLGLYRVYAAPRMGFEIGGGMRYWDVSTKLSLDPGLLPGYINKTTMSWIEPVIAARYTAAFSPRAGVSLYGDLGGFGAGSRLSWQGIASLDYAITDWAVGKFGWRSLGFEKNRNSIDLNTGFNGPFFAVSFRF
jgi:hypothetical protein